VTQTINLFVVSEEKHITDRVSSLSRGSHIAVVGSGPLGEGSMQAIAAIRPQVCLISAREAEEQYLAFARRLFKDVPNTTVVLFGPSDDPKILARAAASKVWNCLPEYVTYPEFIQLVTDADARKPPNNACLFGKTAAAVPPAHAGPTSSHARGLRAVVGKCLDLGLHADDIAWHLNADIDVIRDHIAHIRQKKSRAPYPWRRIGYGALAAAVLVIAYKVGSALWSPGSQRIAVSGKVTYAKQPLDNGLIEFRSKKIIPAVIAGAVIQDGEYEIPSLKGLLPGEYVVMIFSPETSSDKSSGDDNGIAPPARERIPEQYNSSSTQRREVRSDAKKEYFRFDIP